MQLGDVRLHALSAGTFWADGGVLFGLVPRALWGRVAEPDNQNRLRLQMWCLLIETRSCRLLVGTGCSAKLSDRLPQHQGFDGESHLLSELGTLGLDAKDVDFVINTHLHGHHCGGNTVRTDDGAVGPTFPRATYCVQRLELADARHPNARTRAVYHRESFEPLERARQLRVLWGDTRLTDEVRVVVTPGHTRAHQSVIIESRGQTAMLMGGVAPWPIHLERLAWVPAHDVEPMTSIETKRKLARWAVDNRVLLVFEHHPETAAGYLSGTERPDRFRVEPVDCFGSA